MTKTRKIVDKTKARKIVKEKRIDTLVDSYIPVQVTALIDKLQEYIKEYGKGVSIYCSPAGYDGYDEWHLSFERDETPLEIEQRLEEARLVREDKAEAKKKSVEKDRLKYEELKERFGD